MMTTSSKVRVKVVAQGEPAKPHPALKMKAQLNNALHTLANIPIHTPLNGQV